MEDIHGEEQLAWVREQNARTEELLEDTGYAAVEAGILEVLDSTDRIAMVNKRGDFYYNFWKDREHPKGLWRRTTWESYLSDAPDWDVLLDVDALAASEGIEWVFHGAGFLRPSDGSDYRLAMVSLSPDGGDANRYREFDLATRTFVDPADGGFDLPTAKGHVSWLDADTLLASSTADGLAATSSSYARTAVKLRRGESWHQRNRSSRSPKTTCWPWSPTTPRQALSALSPWTTSTSTTSGRRCSVTAPGRTSTSPRTSTSARTANG